MTITSAISGAGMGLRLPHVSHILHNEPDIAWFELLVDNWLNPSAAQEAYLPAVLERYPVVMHGVGLSIGGVDDIDFDYLKRVKNFKQTTQAAWYSEHCSFSQYQGEYIPDLLPLPFTEEAVMHISARIQRVQDFLGEPMLLENVSSYIDCAYSHLSEAEFMAAIVEQSGCELLLDINNCYVSAYNATVSEIENIDEVQALRSPENLHNAVLNYFEVLPNESVKQIHLAGHENREGFLLDTHGDVIIKPVLDLYIDYTKKFGVKPTMVEWDNNIPSFDVLYAEYKKISEVIAQESLSCAS